MIKKCDALTWDGSTDVKYFHVSYPFIRSQWTTKCSKHSAGAVSISLQCDVADAVCAVSHCIQYSSSKIARKTRTNRNKLNMAIMASSALESIRKIQLRLSIVNKDFFISASDEDSEDSTEKSLKSFGFTFNTEGTGWRDRSRTWSILQIRTGWSPSPPETNNDPSSENSRALMPLEWPRKSLQWNGRSFTSRSAENPRWDERGELLRVPTAPSATWIGMGKLVFASEISPLTFPT